MNSTVLRVAEILRESLRKSDDAVRTHARCVNAVRDSIGSYTPDQFWELVKNTIKDPAAHAEFVEQVRPLVSALYLEKGI